MSFRPRRRLLLPVAGLAAGLTAALSFTGCALLKGPTPTPTRFFVLDPVAQPDQAPGGRRLALGLGPLHVPPYLERPEMVRRVSENQLAFDEFDRWGEPFKANLLRVVATNLDRLIGVDRMAFYPWYSNTPLDYAVTVDVLRFEPQPDGQVLLDARWVIGDPHGTPLRSGSSRLTAPAGTPEQTAAAMSSLTGSMSGDIARALREVDTGKRTKTKD
jgi:uncharacterized lipoprotein YmbA